MTEHFDDYSRDQTSVQLEISQTQDKLNVYRRPKCVNFLESLFQRKPSPEKKIRMTTRNIYPVLHTWPFDMVYSSLYISIYGRQMVQQLSLPK